MHCPTKPHLGAAKKVLRYIVGTVDFGIWYSKVADFSLIGYSDSDWAGSIDNRKSTSGNVFNLGSRAISWSSKKQDVVALSSSKAEYVAVTSAACQAIWLQRLLIDIFYRQKDATKIFCDNKATIAMTKNPSFHSRTKHIDIRYHFIRDLTAKGDRVKVLRPKRQRVVALALPDMQLQGTISSSLANFSFLSMLNLKNNSFHGGIPYGLDHLPRLRVIDVSIPTNLFQHRRVQVISLAFNKLGGEMWKGPWYVPELRVLNMGNNSLTDIIPPSVKLQFVWEQNQWQHSKRHRYLSQLAFLVLYDNQLTGSIPTSLFNISSLFVVSLVFNSLYGSRLLGEGNIVSNLKELQVLSISFNNITGEIPRNIGCLSKLEEFYIGDNPIKGTIPASLANISILQYVSCKRNCLEGPIPPELGKLSNLRQLGFGHNYNLIGQIPDVIFNVSSLERIAVNFNNLSGTLPGTTGLHLPNLKELILGVNQIEGEFPLFITNVSKLEILDLSDNFFTGTIPTTLGNLRELRGLFLHSNQLTNEPREHELQFFNSLADCRMLQYLEVGSNPLNGVLPNSIGNLSSTTEVVRLADAHISGFIPANTGNISGLIILDFQNNNLMGNIPAEIRKLKQLQGLFLQYNKFQGHIPEAVCHLSNLVKLFLQVNELYGQIPECIGNLSMLQDLYLGSNKFPSKIPLSLWKMSGLLYVDVSRNSIEGEVPPDIGELKAILELYLSSNNLSGVIPSRLGELLSLQYLDLSNNSFSCQIPLSFANLISLEFLYLSLNTLSGTIPKSLEKLSYLKSINVSLNVLDGEIPSGGVFANSTLQSFLGNKDVCGMHILEVPSCPITKSGQQSKSNKFVLKIVIPVLTSFMILLLVSIWIMKRKKIAKSKDVGKVPEINTYPLISYHEIQRATSNFDGSNLIGVGSSGLCTKQHYLVELWWP
ncbi:LRR receptor-like serine/threonine-protein kinase EFR [Capsicum annuum]|nr:LRR receptor-like serine/threonine-protein kinase EFR [Capsicum annuum]